MSNDVIRQAEALKRRQQDELAKLQLQTPIRRGTERAVAPIGEYSSPRPRS